MIFELSALGVAAVAAAAVIHPYVIYPRTLNWMPSVPVRDVPEVDAHIKFSLLFAAFNESAIVADKLANIEALRSENPGIEVLAYDDGSTDGTADALAARPDLLTLVVGEGRQGKAHGMKQLAAAASGDVLVFSDANVFIAAGSLAALVEAYADPEVGGVCGTLQYQSTGTTATEAVGGAYWMLEEKIKERESRTGNVMGADGSIFSVRRSLYPDFPDTVQDDFTVSMSVIFAGKRLIRSNGVVGVERLVSSRGDEFSRKVRIASRAFHTHRHLLPGLRVMSRRDRYKYVSHKYLRWFGGAFAIVSALATLTFLSLLGWEAVAVAVFASAAGLLVARFAANSVYEFFIETCIALAATLLGVWRASRGAVVATWNPPASR